ncbi:trafficking protein particle complex 2 [Hymenopellis radicata]|nr:trafficking protein particle complex 2 [Hymenopellis radicata]
MAPIRVNAVAFIAANNHPLLIRSFAENPLKYHYIAHTALDVIDERVAASPKNSYLGLLYSIDDVAVYAYITPLNLKIVLAFALADAVIPDIKVHMIFKALHMAYYRASSNPFLTLDPSTPMSSPKWKKFNRQLDDICTAVASGV